MEPLPDFMLPTEKFNLPLARKVLEYAEHEHDDFIFDMDMWYEEFYELNESGKSICKTSACLAGTAAFLAPNVDITKSGVWINGYSYYHFDGGMKLLGINRETADILFYNSDENALSLLRQMVEYAEKHDTSL